MIHQIIRTYLHQDWALEKHTTQEQNITTFRKSVQVGSGALHRPKFNGNETKRAKLNDPSAFKGGKKGAYDGLMVAAAHFKKHSKKTSLLADEYAKRPPPDSKATKYAKKKGLEVNETNVSIVDDAVPSLSLNTNDLETNAEEIEETTAVLEKLLLKRNELSGAKLSSSATVFYTSVPSSNGEALTCLEGGWNTTTDRTDVLKRLFLAIHSPSGFQALTPKNGKAYTYRYAFFES